MRLFGTTLNTGFFAFTELHNAYYRVKIPEIIQVDDRTDEVVGNGDIQLRETDIDMDQNQAKDVLFLKKDIYSPIRNQGEDKKIFKILETFRSQKIYANAEKLGFVHNVVDLALRAAL